MSGGNVTYQLRPNKHVERLLFVELVEKIIAYKSSSFAYISMGGPQLEDHKLFHQELGLVDLFSFEEDDIVYQRQKFNQRPSCVTCIPKTISEFVVNFDNFIDENALIDKTLITWLDYASPKRREQLIEFETLLDKLSPNDVVKITLNANPATLGEAQRGETQEDLFARRLETLREQIGEYLPSAAVSDDMIARRLPAILSGAIEIAAEKGTSKDHRITPVLLSQFSYQDSDHIMLTVTIRLTIKSEEDDFRKNISNKWEYVPKSWQDVRHINIPALSAKERLEIDSKLPTVDFVALHNILPFRLHTDDQKSLEMLQEYARHYRRYPSYFQVVL
ncbi:MAG: hypothetical protein HZB50_12490 [Chloroflexi bacterium]|nr:hypothetical protein [Chloroflexota bacterium]